MRVLLAGSAFLAVLADAPSHSASSAARVPADPHLCRAGETVVYSCRFGSKTGSVCAGGGAHYRFGTTRRIELEISSKAAWNNVRVGWVIGQQGGRQRHIRFVNGATHYVVFEGVDGQLADRPGRTYSGIAVVEGPQGENERATLNCKGRARIHADFTNVVASQAPERLRKQLDEEPGGPFDAWY